MIYTTKYFGASMGGSASPPYACLAVGYLEETILFTEILPLHFEDYLCNQIKKFLSRYMDDGFVFLPTVIDKESFLRCLNLLHTDIKFTLEVAEIDKIQGTQTLNFLDIKVIKKSDNSIETEIYYKSTNLNQYLHYGSQHPKHILDNVPFNLAKRIIIFTSNEEKVEQHLRNMLT